MEGTGGKSMQSQAFWLFPSYGSAIPGSPSFQGCPRIQPAEREGGARRRCLWARPGNGCISLPPELTWPELGHMAPHVAAGEAGEMWSRHIPGREMKWGWMDSSQSLPRGPLPSFATLAADFVSLRLEFLLRKS